MKYFPVYLDIKGRRCLVVGGGPVALRKAQGLLEAGARVTAVSPEFSEGFTLLAGSASFETIRRSYRSTDLDEKFLVIGATDNNELNRKISRDAQSLNILCNIADVPEACNFILPSVVHRGDLMIAISTSGKSPAFARHLRKQLEKQFGEEYTEFLRIMGAVRKKLLAKQHAPEAHKPLFESLISKGLPEMIREGRTDEADTTLREVLGEEFDYGSLRDTAED
ncbi:MAG: bifunctional precorrin-2 dehydrogenase/sirohydrochlorin ferrochelatase [Desulfobacteraceae bacterium]|nr:bifunctional precorrin-2 dehydrogenase/sirohydrochlorin ferrochelatase [Desulfobacteraceae bacterium]MCF8094017.1 bifunctional precorrin-2 dehydrogenase/sirohydrochlorin ferrochelatase [Desulfobacteraceae bacterium]